jgi:protein phosphatase 1 regulatory subunit 37
LNGTDLSSEGAIALAEFLPEARSILHIDLTSNFEIDIAGVMALCVSIKMNNTLRCLDLNIPANDPEFARLSQEILQW